LCYKAYIILKLTYYYKNRGPITMNGKKIMIFLVLVIIVLGSIDVHGLSANSKILKISDGGDSPTISITIDYIEEIDPLDVGSKPDWYYIIEVYKNENWWADPQIITQDVNDEPDTYDPNVWQVDKTHEFDAHHYRVPINIILKEDDGWPDDTADISAKLGENPEDESGKKFTIVYNLNTNNIISRDEEDWDEDGDYIILNGEKDGRGEMGPGEEHWKEDDAKMRIKIEDNINQLTSPSLSIQGNPSTTPTDVDITFLCSIQGGCPPFIYRIYPCGSMGAQQITVDSSERSITKSYKYDTSCQNYHGYKTPYLYLTDNLGVEITYEMPDDILVNNPPNKPSKPTYQFTGFPGTPHKYSTSATDPDDLYGRKQSLQYKWSFDGVEEEWGEASMLYKEKKFDVVKVKVRDDGDLDGEFDDGAESDWSEPCPRNKIKPETKTLFYKLIENVPNLLPFIRQFFYF
jgi:hypothetical protein